MGISAKHTPALRATPLKRGPGQGVRTRGSPLERGARRAGCVRAFAACLAFACFLAPARAAEPPPPTTDELYDAAKKLFDDLATPEVKAQFEFPSRAQWETFFTRLERALASDSLEDLAGYRAEARTALTTLRGIGGYEDLADWLEQRLDEIEGAQQATKPPEPKPPVRPGTPPPRVPPVPHYDLWLARVRNRPPPARAATLMPALRAAFAAEGTPPELAWLAEAESSLNPAARSPVGAKGLFQFMPDTAQALGLSTLLPDDRTNPEKSAHAAARYLRTLHGRFHSWSLALAAYNAGEGRVARALAARKATTFTAIADTLPAETRMYVPKVYALIATRTGVAPHEIPAPRK